MTYIKTLAISLLALLASVASAQNAAQSLRAIPLNAGMHVITAEVAATNEQRAIGLMHRDSMPTNHGMLFVFDEPQPQCFWMRNTRLPLSIAFIDDTGQVVNIADMQPMTETSHCSTKPVRFALEMNIGWFAKRGIKAGSKLSGAPWPK